MRSAVNYQAGDLRHLVTIKQKTNPTVTDFGGAASAWSTTFAANVPSLVTEDTGTEIIAADKRTAFGRYTVVFHHLPNVLPDMRVEWNSLVLNVVSVSDPQGNSVWTVLKCVRVK